MEFLGQMLFGIQAARDTLMSEIARSLQEDILAKKTQERLERHLATEGMDAKIHGSILCDAASGIHDDTLVIVDPTDVQKEYAEKMPYLAKVWDGSRGRVGDTIRFIKQSYRLEHMRLLDYRRLKNMAALVVAVAYFAAAWLGRKVKLDALAKNWHIHGAASSLGNNRIDFGDWRFPLGTNDEAFSAFWYFIDGRIRPVPHDAAHEICAVGVPMSAVPVQSRLWRLDGGDGNRILTWENFFLGGDTNSPVNAQIVLCPNGDFLTRSNDVEIVCRRVNPDDWDGDGLANARDANPTICDGDFFGVANALPTNANLDAYYWLDLSVTGLLGVATIRVTCDGPSDLGDHVIIARTNEVCHIPLLVGAAIPISAATTTSQGQNVFRVSVAADWLQSNGIVRNADAQIPEGEFNLKTVQAAGTACLVAAVGSTSSVKKQCQQQADVFYYSGHGEHDTGRLYGVAVPADVTNHWRDVETVVFAGCSVLDIGDKGNHYSNPASHSASPGLKWAALSGASALLGYCWKAPLDNQGGVRIINNWCENRTALGDVESWMQANANRNGRNACAIQNIDDSHCRYWYFKREKGYIYNSYSLTNSIEAITR